MEIMAVPNPKAYVLKKEDMETIKHLTIGIEDGWIDGSTNEAMEKYQKAKDALRQYDLIKTIKSDAYKEFAARLKENSWVGSMREPRLGVTFGPEIIITEKKVDETLAELESEL